MNFDLNVKTFSVTLEILVKTATSECEVDDNFIKAAVVQMEKWIIAEVIAIAFPWINMICIICHLILMELSPDLFFQPFYYYHFLLFYQLALYNNPPPMYVYV